MADTELIHAGLPWNNPLKITVKADLYISLLVINRGLLNLLSNDYYLDLKSLRINQYIVDLVGPHIADTTIHWTEDGVVDILKRFLNGELGNYIDSFGLLKDTAFIIPVVNDLEFPKNVNRIQNIINNCPKNLNGHTAIFALTPVISGNYIEDNPDTEDIDETVKYNYTIGDYYSRNKSVISASDYDVSEIFASSGCASDIININLHHKSIMMNGFYGGTVILMGNDFFICEDKYRNGGKSLNTRLTRILLLQIQKCIDKPTSKHITLSGSGLNNTRSVVSFNNCNCDSYLWNLGVTLDTGIESNEQTNPNTPKKRLLALYFPCNLVDDKVSGSVRYVVADAINDENFNLTYLTLRARDNVICGMVTSGITLPEISAVNLNNDYLMLSSSYNQFIQTFFGKYIGDDEVINDSLYEGATFCFWMKDNLYDKNVNEVPIIYTVDGNGDGYYIGLEKIANINHGEMDVSQYIDTTYASKKRTDLNGKWNFWAVQIEPKDLAAGTYLVDVAYYNPYGKQLLSILPNKTTLSLAYNDSAKNQINFSHINFGYPLSFFGTPDIRSTAYIRNIMLFNQPLCGDLGKHLIALAQQGLCDTYNLSEIDLSQSFKNGMKGALYVYNTTSMNVIGCDLKKVVSMT